MEHFLVRITVINGEQASQTETFIEAENKEEAAGGALALEVSEGAKRLSWDVAESGDCETLYEVSRIVEVDEEDLAAIRKYFTVYNCSASLIETTFLTGDDDE